MTAEQITQELQIAQDILKDSKTAIGVGLLGWKLSGFDKKSDNTLADNASYEKDHPQATERIDAALRGGAKAIWLGFGSPREVVFWSKAVRARSQCLKLPADGLALFVSVGSETEAKAAIEQTDADVLVAQGQSTFGDQSKRCPHHFRRLRSGWSRSRRIAAFGFFTQDSAREARQIPCRSETPAPGSWWWTQRRWILNLYPIKRGGRRCLWHPLPAYTGVGVL